MTYPSLCFLSYERADFLGEAIRSAVANAGTACEVIVHDDGSRDPRCVEVARTLMDEGYVSRIVLEPVGRNEGVGAAFNRAAAVATGDPVIKLDQDLIFLPDWLSRTVDWLEADPEIGMLGLFRYYLDPVDWRQMNHEAPSADADYEYVDDFVGSAMAIPRRILDRCGPLPEHSAAFAEDVEYKQGLRAAGLRLALPREDLAVNRGFGIGPSTIVFANSSGDVGVTEIHSEPYLVGEP